MEKIIRVTFKTGNNPYKAELGKPMRVLSLTKSTNPNMFTARILVQSTDNPQPCDFTIAIDGTQVDTSKSGSYICSDAAGSAGLWSTCFGVIP